MHENAFDKNDSLVLKGIAILMMLFHHCFRDVSLYQSYTVSFFPFPEHIIVHLAYVSKICVSLFAFISGYGLLLSCRKKSVSATRWTAVRYIRTFSGYWFVWVISAIVCQLINHRTQLVLFKEGIWRGLLYSVIDFSGTASLFATPTINGTWWYMSAAAVFILLVPLVNRCRKNLWLVLFAAVALLRVLTGKNGDGVFPGNNSIFAFLTPFLLGCIFAEYTLFDRWLAVGTGVWWKKALKAVGLLGLLVVCYLMYLKIPVAKFWELHYGIVPLVLIVFCAEFILPIPGLRTVLRFFGKHAMNIYLVHTFIRAYYLNDFTYSLRHFIPIVAVLFAISLGISLLLELLKKAIRYPKLIDKLCDTIEQAPTRAK